MTRNILRIVSSLILTGTTFVSCQKENTDNVPSDKEITISCIKPDYLVAGDKIALISPSYHTPMENVEKTADVLRGWGFETVIGPNVGKIADGRYAGTIEERVSDIHWALSQKDVKAIICNRGGYGTMSSFLADGGTEFTFENVESMLGNYLKEYDIPLLCGFPAGHGDVNLPLVMGSQVCIDVRNNGASISFNIDGEQVPVNTAETAKAQPMPLSRRLFLSGKRD